MKKFIVFFIWIFIVTSIKPAAAQTAVDLADFVVGPIGHTHSLSTGEAVSYTSEGGQGPTNTPVRMYKNSNYEQLYIGASHIYRREDTSWAPVEGFQPAYCSNGHIASYTSDIGCKKYNDGDVVSTDGHKWAPRSVSLGQTWAQDTFQVVTIDSTNTSPRRYCTVNDPPGYISGGTPPCNQTPQTQFSKYYAPGTFTFCTGIKNVNELIELSGVSGPGHTEKMLYMKGWGLVGFEAPDFLVGLMGPGATTTNCKMPFTNTGYLTIKGSIYSTRSEQIQQTNATVTSRPIGGAVITVAEEVKEGDLIISRDIRQITTSSSNGNFSIFVKIGAKKNYLVFMCGSNVKQVGLMETTTNVKGLEIYLDCPSNMSPNKSIETLNGLGADRKLTHILRGDSLSCGLKPDLKEADIDAPNILEQTVKEVVNNVNLKFEENIFAWRFPSPGYPTKDDGNDKNFGEREQMDGRADVSGRTIDLKQILTNACLWLGCAQGTKSSWTYESEGKPSAPSCDKFKACNSSIGLETDDPNYNQQTCGGSAFNLATPFGEVKKQYENVINYLNQHPDEKNKTICTNNGSDIKFCEIEPPLEIASGSLCAKKLSSEYFPYEYLFGLSKNPVVIKAKTDLDGDSIKPNGENVREVAFDTKSDTAITAEKNGKPNFAQTDPAQIYPSGPASPLVNRDLFPDADISFTNFLGTPGVSNGSNIQKEYKESNFNTSATYKIIGLESICLCAGSTKDNGYNRENKIVDSKETNPLGKCLESNNSVLLNNGNGEDVKTYAGYKFAEKEDEEGTNPKNVSFYGVDIWGKFSSYFSNLFDDIAHYAQVSFYSGDPDGTCVVNKTDTVGGVLKKIFGYSPDCKATVYKDLKVKYKTKETNQDPIIASTNLSLAFANPFDKILKTSSTCVLDAKATKETKAGGGLGNEFDCGSNSYNPVNIMKKSFSDPAFGTTEQDENIENPDEEDDLLCKEFGNAPMPTTNPQAGAIASRAYSIVSSLKRGVWCYHNNSPEYPDIWNPPSDYPECVKTDPDSCSWPMGNGKEIFWCTWLVFKAYGDLPNDLFLLGTPLMRDYFRNTRGHGFVERGVDIVGKGIRPGDTFFLSKSAGGDASHVSIIYEIKLDSNKNGYIITVDSNNEDRFHNYSVVSGKVQDQRDVFFAGIGKQ